MKKISLVCLLVLVASFCFCYHFAYAKMVKDENGNVRIIPDPPKSLDLTPEETQACETGKDVLTKFSYVDFKKIDFFRYVSVRKYSEAISCQNMQLTTKKIEKKEVVEEKDLLFLLTIPYFVYFLSIFFLLFLFGEQTYFLVRIFKFLLVIASGSSGIFIALICLVVGFSFVFDLFFVVLSLIPIFVWWTCLVEDKSFFEKWRTWFFVASLVDVVALFFYF